MVEEPIGPREVREPLDRAWSSNDKVQFDNVVSHNNMAARYAEVALSNAVQFQSQMNGEYLKMVTQEREHQNQIFQEKLENNRYTLDRLYSIFPEEAVGLRILIESIVDAKLAAQK